MAIVLTGLVNYTQLDVPDPLAIGIDMTGVSSGSKLVKLGAICGLSAHHGRHASRTTRVFFSMSNDGLLPKFGQQIRPRFRTPYISTALVGILVATVAALTPIDVLGEMVSIGTLLAFIIVCAGVWVLRRRGPNLPRAFVTPWVPFTPIMGILISALMMYSLSGLTWLRLLVWLAIGLVIYFLAAGVTAASVTLNRREQMLRLDKPGIRVSGARLFYFQARSSPDIPALCYRAYVILRVQMASPDCRRLLRRVRPFDRVRLGIDIVFLLVAAIQAAG